jgi:signal transduction histidine kinase
MKQPARHEPTILLSAVLCVVLVVGMAWLRLGVFGQAALPVGYAVPVVIAAWTRRRALFWGVVIAFAALTVWKFGFELNRTAPARVSEHIWSGSAVLVDLFITALLVDLFFKSRLASIQQREEISAQNERLKAQAAELERREGESVRLRREAEEASVRKSRFLAAASHDIRTPANAIGLLAELVQRSAIDPEARADVPELAQELQKCSMGLVGLIGDVLDLTRLDLGQVELRPVEFELGAWLKEECAKLQPLAEEKQLGFECVPPAQPVRLSCDQSKLGRIVANLIGNAVKYTQKGQVQVSAEQTKGGPARIVVRDTGIGIATEFQEKIFDEYFQLKHPDRDRNKGTGLGLSISKRFLDVMGGQLTVQSALGEGSTFTVTLPASMVVG